MAVPDVKNLKELERLIKSPKKPTTIKDARDLRFPGVVMKGREHIEQSRELGKHAVVDKGKFYNQGYSDESEKDFARWMDHRTLLRQKASPKRLPTDVPKHIWDAVENMRAGRLVDKTGLLYECEYEAAQEFFRTYCYGNRLQAVYEPSYSVWHSEAYKEWTERRKEQEAARRLAQETMGILTTLPYMFSPAREVVENQVDKVFHPRMKHIIQAITKMMSESDLSFADAHHIARLLNQMLSDLPAPPEQPPSPPPVVEVPVSGGSSKKGGESGKGEGLDKEKPKGVRKSAGDQKVGWADEDSFDWSKREYTPPTYAPQVRQQLQNIGYRVNNAFNSMYRGYYGKAGNYFSYNQIAQTHKALGKTTSGRMRRYVSGDGETEWCPMTIETPKLTQETVRPKEVGRGYRHIASESGRVPRNMHRFATDQRVFSTKRHRRGGIALLCDVSGSMHVSVHDIDMVLNRVPASVIALHSGTRGEGMLRVVAKDGRRVHEDKMKDGMGGGNGVDLPALRWLAKQPCGGKYWLADGAVTGRRQQTGWQLLKDCDDFCREHDIYQVQDIKELFGVIFEGRPLRPRTMAKWAEEWFGKSW